MKVLTRSPVTQPKAKRLIERYLARRKPTGAVRVYLETIRLALEP